MPDPFRCLPHALARINSRPVGAHAAVRLRNYLLYAWPPNPELTADFEPRDFYLYLNAASLVGLIVVHVGPWVVSAGG